MRAVWGARRLIAAGCAKGEMQRGSSVDDAAGAWVFRQLREQR